MTKKNVLLFSSVYIVYFFAILIVSIGCSSMWCRIREDDPFGFVLITFISIIPVFFFSLITYKMKEEVFHVWWSFARWFVPIIIVVTFLLENAGSGGGYLNAGRDFTVFILFILYSIFIITSLTKIVLAYRKMKQ